MQRIRDHVYEFDQLIIGGTLAAFLYGYCNSLPVLYIDKKAPPNFEVSANKIFDKALKIELWNRLGASLSLGGLLPFADKINSVRIIEKNYAEAYMPSRRFRISFNKLLIFDEDKVEGLGEPVFHAKKEYKVYDWLLNKGMSKHQTQVLESDSDFVKKVIFYPSQRKGAQRTTMDMVAISYLTDEQINTLDYSENFARLKAKNMMKEAGLRGYSNGFSKTKQATQYYAIVLEHERREAHTLGRDIYRNTATIAHHLDKEQDIDVVKVNKQLQTIGKRLW